MATPHADHNGPPALNTPRLPYELISAIARMLADEGALRTVAHLTETSRNTCLETLPALYETLQLEDEAAFLRSVQSKDSRGWKYVNYLFLSDITRHLLLQHIRYTRNDFSPDLSLSSAFPRLVFVRTLNPVEGGIMDRSEKATPCSIELHAPIPLDVLFDRCSFSKIRDMRYRGGEVYAPVRLSFFGIRFAHSSDMPQRERFPVDPPLDVNISEIPGLFLPFSEGITKRLQKEGRYTNGPEMNHFALTVRDEKANEGIKTTIRAILDYAKFHIKVAMKESYMHPSIYFKLSCHPAVLKAFAQLFKARQPLHISQLDITLLGSNLTQIDMYTALTSIAECYASKWKHNTETFHVNFVEIQCPIPVPERYLQRAQDRPDATGLMVGHLSPGPGYFPDLELGGVNPGVLGFDRRRGDEHLGFHAEMQAGWRVRGRWQDGETLFRRYYPCAHVPDPMWE